MSGQSRVLAMSCAFLVAIGAAAPLSARSQTAPSPPASRPIDLKSPDGIALKASYFPAARPGPGLLLFHACNSDRSSWNELAAAAAARGFHVIALDYRGYGESRGTRSDDPQQQQWIADREWPGDVDAAYAWLTSQPGVDKTRLGAAGASCGVNQAVQLARRHPEVRTVVLLSGAFTAKDREFVRDSAWLPIFGAASHGDGGAVEAMRWGMGWSRNTANEFAVYQAAGHGAEMFAKEKDLQPKVLAWFERYVRDAPATRPAVTTAAGPTVVEQFWTTLNQPGGVTRARQLYDEAKARDKDVVLFPESETNLLGYQLMQNGDPKDAVTVLQMNLEAYPRSSNAADSLSDAWLAAGDKEQALTYARKAIAMLDEDPNATPQFRQLVRESAEGKIKQLQGERK
jgi:dienelactone hydrolase